MDCAQFRRVVFLVLADKGVLIDFPQTRADRAELHLDPGRQFVLRPLQPLEDELPSEVVVYAVFEDNGYQAQSDFGNRAHFCQFRQPGKLHLDRARDQLFHVGRRHPACGGQHLHLHVCDIREGVDGDLFDGQHAETGEDDSRQQDEQPLPDGKGENGVYHFLFLPEFPFEQFGYQDEASIGHDLLSGIDAFENLNASVLFLA